MHTGFIFNRYLQRDRIWFSGFLLLWLLGLVVGISLGAVITRSTADTVVYRDFLAESNFLWCVLVTTSPILIVGLLLHFRLVPFLIPLILLDAVSRGFAGIFLFMMIGSGAWLIRGLFLASGCCSSVLMWWVIIRYCQFRGASLKKDVQISLTISAITAVLDTLIISPFLHLLSFYF